GTEKIDHRADIYALGCMLFALLCGNPPFHEGIAGVIMSLQMDEPPPAPSTRAPDIPPVVDALVLRCLQKSPDARFQNAADLASEITNALSALRASTGPVQPRAPTAADAPTIVPVRASLADLPTVRALQAPSITSAPTVARAAVRPRRVAPYVGGALA